MNTHSVDVERRPTLSASRYDRSFQTFFRGLIAGQPARAYACLALLAFILFLPGFFTLPPMDRDEPRFAQATKQMIETGDVVSIRFQDEARNKKPVGIYWLQALSVKAAEIAGLDEAREAIWVYRIPSLMAAIGAVLLTFWTARAMVSSGAAFIAALLLASTILLNVEAHLAKTDAVLAMTVAAAMGAFARVYFAPADTPFSWRLPVVFWTALAAGILVKGPITPMIVLFAGIVLAVLDRRRGRPVRSWVRRLRPGWGLCLCLALVAPWFVLILLKTQGAFFSDSLGKDMLGKVAGAKEAHGAPPGVYLLAFFVTAWPLAPIAVLAARFAWTQRTDRRVALLLAWLMPAWILFELVPTKLPHYVLPLYPAIAILAALAIEAGALRAIGSRTRGFAAGLIMLVPVAVAIAVVVIAKGDQARLGVIFLLGMPALLIVALGIARAVYAGLSGMETLAACLAGLAFGLSVLCYQVLVAGPFGREFALSPRLVVAARAALDASPQCAAASYATISYREPSLVFLTATDLVMDDAAHVAAFVAGAPCRVAFVGSSDEKSFLAALPSTANVVLASRVEGTNLNGGKHLDIGVYVDSGPAS